MMTFPSLDAEKTDEIAICLIDLFLFQADPETDEVYAQMTLQPVNKVGQLLIFQFEWIYIIKMVNSPKVSEGILICFSPVVWPRSFASFWYGSQAK